MSRKGGILLFLRLCFSSWLTSPDVNKQEKYNDIFFRLQGINMVNAASTRIHPLEPPARACLQCRPLLTTWCKQEPRIPTLLANGTAQRRGVRAPVFSLVFTHSFTHSLVLQLIHPPAPSLPPRSFPLALPHPLISTFSAFNEGGIPRQLVGSGTQGCARGRGRRRRWDGGVVL